MDIGKGIFLEYDQALKSHENGFHGAQLPGCLARKVFHDFSDKKVAMSAMSEEENLCPICGDDDCDDGEYCDDADEKAENQRENEAKKAVEAVSAEEAPKKTTRKRTTKKAAKTEEVVAETTTEEN